MWTVQSEVVGLASKCTGVCDACAQPVFKSRQPVDHSKSYTGVYVRYDCIVAGTAGTAGEGGRGGVRATSRGASIFSPLD